MSNSCDVQSNNLDKSINVADMINLFSKHTFSTTASTAFEVLRSGRKPYCSLESSLRKIDTVAHRYRI